ncbi:hypothetical protein MMC18_000902 [Xylographa bjoerkii]|nr:hypothetical protein [Xylographa bjoerkii]
MNSTGCPSGGVNSSASTVRDQQPYSDVNVLLVSYKKQDDLSEWNSYYVTGLKHIFSHIYLFHTEVWNIPSKKSHEAMKRKLISLIGNDDPRVLKILYYTGHASQNRFSEMIWATGQEEEAITWGGPDGLQILLERARSDALIILDCCHAVSVNTTNLSRLQTAFQPGPGNTWLLAACAHNATTGNSVFSLTSVLLRALPVLAESPHGFSLEELYRQILRTISRPENSDWKTVTAPILVLLSSGNPISQQIWLRPLP